MALKPFSSNAWTAVSTNRTCRPSNFAIGCRTAGRRYRKPQAPDAFPPHIRPPRPRSLIADYRQSEDVMRLSF
jgi:hypothetical protein